MIAICRPRGDRDTLRQLLPKLLDIVDITCRARASASASIRPTACCGKGPRAISSPGWTPRWTIGW